MSTKRHSELELEIEQLTAASAGVAKDGNLAPDDFAAAIDAMTSELASAVSAREAADRKVEELETAVADAIAQRDAALAAQEAAVSKCDTCCDGIDLLEHQLGESKAIIARFELEHLELSTQLEEKTAFVAELEAKLAETEAAHNDTGATAVDEASSAELSSLREELEASKQAEKAHAERLQTLESELDALRKSHAAELEGLAAVSAAKELRATELETQLAESNDVAAKADARVVELTAEVAAKAAESAR